MRDDIRMHLSFNIFFRDLGTSATVLVVLQDLLVERRFEGLAALGFASPHHK